MYGPDIRPEEILRLTKLDPHSLGKWRVDGALPSYPELVRSIQYHRT